MRTEATPRELPLQYQSCKDFKGKTDGHSDDDEWIAWYNAYPADAIQWGIESLAQRRWQAPPDITLAGVNYGMNTGSYLQRSGTCAVADASMKLGVPAIAFSGAGKDKGPLREGEMGLRQDQYPSERNANGPRPWVQIYSEVQDKIVTQLVEKGFLQVAGVWLNVNLSAVSASCQSADDFRYFLARADPKTRHLYRKDNAIADEEDDDFSCERRELPLEQEVLKKGHCRVAISINGGLIRPEDEKAAIWDHEKQAWKDAEEVKDLYSLEEVPDKTWDMVKGQLRQILTCK